MFPVLVTDAFFNMTPGALFLTGLVILGIIFLLAYAKAKLL